VIGILRIAIDLKPKHSMYFVRLCIADFILSCEEKITKNLFKTEHFLLKLRGQILKYADLRYEGIFFKSSLGKLLIQKPFFLWTEDFLN
jgi:hypothetical protein